MASPPIPWDVELGKWFESCFPPFEKHHSYARTSRRQSSTPDFIRPGYINREEDLQNRNFGVVIDTSGSVSDKQIGLALGAVASYAVSRDVQMARVVFCDARAYDAGYLETEQIAVRVEITGRGGTVLQPEVTLLEKARDFPADGPVLIITDGKIEERLKIHRKHAYLLPKGKKIRFRPKAPFFILNKVSIQILFPIT